MEKMKKNSQVFLSNSPFDIAFYHFKLSWGAGQYFRFNTPPFRPKCIAPEKFQHPSAPFVFILN